MKPCAAIALLLLILQSLIADELPSWRPGSAKERIVQFLAEVTQPGGPHFVTHAERVAVFDNDGTLWCEQPAYPQFIFGMDRIKLAREPESDWSTREPFKSALAGNLEGVVSSGVHGLIELTAGTHGGMTAEDFNQIAARWVATAQHPKFKRPYRECVYQPMLELLQCLRNKGFKTYIVSGGALEFMRAWAEEAYGIPREQLIGSTVATQHATRDGLPVILRTKDISLVNDGPQKVLSIERIIGRRPIMAFGNSDGDLPMIEWTAAGKGRTLCAYIHHTDSEREYAYDRQAKTGKLDKGLVQAEKRGWLVVDMRRDWDKMFAFQHP